MRKSKTNLLMLSVFQTLIMFDVSASTRTNPFDLIEEPELLQLTNDRMIHECKKALTQSILLTIISPNDHYKVNIENCDTSNGSDMISILISVYFQNLEKAKLNKNNRQSFLECIRKIIELHKLGIISDTEKYVAFGIMPHAQYESICYIGYLIENKLSLEHDIFGWQIFDENIYELYYRSATHPNAPFIHVITMAMKIDKLGRGFSMSAIKLILDEMKKRQDSLTAMDISTACKKIISIACLQEDAVINEILDAIENKYPSILKNVSSRIAELRSTN